MMVLPPKLRWRPKDKPKNRQQLRSKPQKRTAKGLSRKRVVKKRKKLNANVKMRSARESPKRKPRELDKRSKRRRTCAK